MKTNMDKGNLIADERFYSREPLGTEHDILAGQRLGNAQIRETNEQ